MRTCVTNRRIGVHALSRLGAHAHKQSLAHICANTFPSRHHIATENQMADAVLSDAFDVLNNAAAYEPSDSIEHSDSEHSLIGAQWCGDGDECEPEPEPISAAAAVARDTVRETPPPPHAPLNTDTVDVAAAAAESAAAPKYQRRSYDDRELPVVVRTNRAIPWYHHIQHNHTHNSITHSSRPSNNNAHHPHQQLCISVPPVERPASPPPLATQPTAASSSYAHANNNNNHPNVVYRKKAAPPLSRSRGYKLGSPDYGDDIAELVPRTRSRPSSSTHHSYSADGHGASAPAPVVVFRRHRVQHPLAMATAASAAAGGRTNNNNRSETDSSDGSERTGAQRKVLAAEKRRRGVRNAERDANSGKLSRWVAGGLTDY